MNANYISIPQITRSSSVFTDTSIFGLPHSFCLLFDSDSCQRYFYGHFKKEFPVAFFFYKIYLFLFLRVKAVFSSTVRVYFPQQHLKTAIRGIFIFPDLLIGTRFPIKSELKTNDCVCLFCTVSSYEINFIICSRFLTLKYVLQY